MAQCVGRTKRSGERCKRSALTGASTCFYHRTGAAKVKRAAAGRGTGSGQRGVARKSGDTAFTTKELSKRTWADFETLFAEGTGWGRCACLAALRVRRPSRGVARTWAAQREANLGVQRGLVDQGRSHGILVYEAGEPVGWCQFGPKDELPVTDDAATGAAWRVTCFVADPSHRGRGVPQVALRAALKAIGKKGGGVVEGYPRAITPGPAPKDDQWLTKDESGRMRRNPSAAIVRRDGDVVFYGGSARIRFGVEVEGVGPVAAMYPNSAFYTGTVDLFRREGFEAVAVVPRPTSPRARLLGPDIIVMRRTV